MSAADLIDHLEHDEGGAFDAPIFSGVATGEYTGNWHGTVEGLGRLARDCVVDGATIILENSRRTGRLVVNAGLGFINVWPPDTTLWEVIPPKT